MARPKRVLILAALALPTLLACQLTPATPAATVQSTLSGTSQLPDPKSQDARVYAAFPEESKTIVGSAVPKDTDGLIGRNWEWGAMYSPRFQMGAGRAVRIALVAGAEPQARLAFLAIQAGTDAVQEDGYLPSSVPEEVAKGRSLTEGDIAGGAAMFLGDACLGMLALETADDPSRVASSEARQNVIDDIDRATEWLLTQRQLLAAIDQAAPNRLFFDARAFQACGELTGNAEAIEEAAEFAEMALAGFDTEGYFVEGGGWDTSYQAVAIYVAHDLLLAGFVDQDDQLRETLHQAATWLAGRVDEQGQIDSSGNTRTCDGGEVFLGNPKKVAVPSVFMALAFVGVYEDDDQLTGTAQRVSDWIQNNPGTDPCFPR